MKLKSLIPANLVMVLLLIIVLILARCGGGGDPAPATASKQDDVKARLTAPTWKIQTVAVDGSDKTSTYKDLSLKFSATGFTSTNGGVVWPANGTWSFTNTDATAVKRDDGVEVKLQEVTDNALKLSLTWSKTTLGREGSVSGQYVFTFTK